MNQRSGLTFGSPKGILYFGRSIFWCVLENTYIDTGAYRTIQESHITMVLREEGNQNSQRQMAHLQMLKDNREGKLNFGIPSNNETTQTAQRDHGEDSWRFKVVEFIHLQWVQKLLMYLLVLDVLLLFFEFFLLASYVREDRSK